MTADQLVRVAPFHSEPMARLWEQTLRQEGIPCMARPLGAGPGVLGPTSAMPYGLYVDAANAEQARYLLGRSAEMFPEDTGTSYWSLWSWPPLARAIAFFFLLIFLGAVVVELYLAIAR